MNNAMPRFEVIPARQWKNTRTGATASVYGACPWTRDSERIDWIDQNVGFTVRDTVKGTVGIGRAPWPTQELAQSWADTENARLAECAREALERAAKRGPEIHLQGVGKHPAIPASELRVGDKTVWNYGYIETVLSIAPKGKQSLTVEIRSEESGREMTRTLRRSRLVAVQR